MRIAGFSYLVGGIGLEHFAEKSPEVQQNKRLSNTQPNAPQSGWVQKWVQIIANDPEFIEAVEDWESLPDEEKHRIINAPQEINE